MHIFLLMRMRDIDSAADQIVSLQPDEQCHSLAGEFMAGA